MKKKIVITATVLVLVIAGALFGAAWYFTSMIIDPPVKKCDPEHFIYCGNPSELNLPFEEVSFKTKDGLTLYGWFIPSGNSDRAVIMVHGHTASRNEGMRWVKSFHNGGFNILTFDLRNSGKSEGDSTSMGYHEKKDVIAAVDYLFNERNTKKIGVFGVSMGAATSALAMAEDERIRAGIFEAGYADFKDLLATLAKRDFGLPNYPLMPLVIWVFEMRTGADMDDFAMEKNLPRISPRPVMIIHCKEDNYIPYEHGLRNFQAAQSNKEMWTSPCKKHARAWQGDQKTGEMKTVGFMKKHVQ